MTYVLGVNEIFLVSARFSGIIKNLLFNVSIG